MARPRSPPPDSYHASKRAKHDHNDERDRDRHRDGDHRRDRRDRDRDYSKDRDRDRNRDRDRERERDRDRDRVRDRDKERERERERERVRDRERARERDRDRRRPEEHDKAKYRDEKRRDERGREKERERDKPRESRREEGKKRLETEKPIVKNLDKDVSVDRKIAPTTPSSLKVNGHKADSIKNGGNGKATSKTAKEDSSASAAADYATKLRERQERAKAFAAKKAAQKETQRQKEEELKATQLAELARTKQKANSKNEASEKGLISREAPKISLSIAKMNKSSNAIGVDDEDVNEAPALSEHLAAVDNAEANNEEAIQMEVDDEDEQDDDLAGNDVQGQMRSVEERVREREEREAASQEVEMKDESAGGDNGIGRCAGTTNGAGLITIVDDEVDPLDAFMVDVNAEVRAVDEADLRKMGTQMDVDTSVNGEEESDDDHEEEDIIAAAAKKIKRKEIANVDHSNIDYESFRKNFYVEPQELAELDAEQVEVLRVDLDGIKIRGIDCPKPIQKWSQAGMSVTVMDVVKRLNYEKPTSIQAQAVPAIMSGRDVIGVAKTGSGKTIAFLLPMFRHIKDQRPLRAGEGPISLIMTPTRELAVQIHRDCKPFVKALNLRAVCAYGGSPIKDQIAELKRGAEIIVCTPGRMIDLLAANNGRLTNLTRITYVVLDEADRMFDMGFEPQVMKIVINIRPDAQKVLFSATFPRQMEGLARKLLRKPVEITVGGRSVVAPEITQFVEIREQSTKFNRLLEILGQAYNDDEDTRTLIFVERQEAADGLLAALMPRGYPCGSLHGGKDQADRDSAISDFKAGIIPIIVATSVAARGLDVKQLKLVINYDCPNHMEDYVHRVGRTGRAGNKGTAYTFITPDQERYAVDILKALKASNAPVPPDLDSLVEGFFEKVKGGAAKMSKSSGFGGKGLEKLEKDRDAVLKIQRIAYGEDTGQEKQSTVRDEDGEYDEAKVEELRKKALVEEARKREQHGSITPSASADTAASAPVLTSGAMSVAKLPGSPAIAPNTLNATAQTSPSSKSGSTQFVSASNVKIAPGVNLQKAKDIIAGLNAKFRTDGTTRHNVGTDGIRDPDAAEFSATIEINDYPQKARWKVTNKETMVQVSEATGAAITTRGQYIPPGVDPKGNERKLYLMIEGEQEHIVDHAVREIKHLLTEATISAFESEARGTSGLGTSRYSVL